MAQTADACRKASAHDLLVDGDASERTMESAVPGMYQLMFRATLTLDKAIGVSCHYWSCGQYHCRQEL